MIKSQGDSNWSTIRCPYPFKIPHTSFSTTYSLSNTNNISPPSNILIFLLHIISPTNPILLILLSLLLLAQESVFVNELYINQSAKHTQQ